jgi:L-ascorbate metabolism protein UlaG (beta-lactamase superfamily)
MAEIEAGDVLRKASTRFPVSDHCDGTRFFNPHRATLRGARDMFRLWRDPSWKAAPWPEAPADAAPVDVALGGAGEPEGAVPPGSVAATFIGQSSFLVRVGNLRLLTDPVLSDRAGPFGRFGPRRARPPGIGFDALPPVDLTLVSHGHYDHMDLPTLRWLTERSFDGRAPTLFVSGLGNKDYLERRGVRPVEELDWWESVEGPAGSRVTFVPAQHWSRRSAFDRDRTLWGGFVVEAAGATVYFAGDSGYCPHFREIGERFPRIDLALLPIGAYEPRWFMAPQHMNPAEAVRSHLDLGARASLAMHFGTFRLTPEPVDEPVRALARALAEAGVDPAAFRVPGFGETVVVPGGVPAGAEAGAEAG